MYALQIHAARFQFLAHAVGKFRGIAQQYHLLMACDVEHQLCKNLFNPGQKRQPIGLRMRPGQQDTVLISPLR